MLSTFAQAAPVATPQLDWLGLLPVILPAGGAVLLLMIRSLAPRLAAFDAAFTFCVAAAGLISVAAQWNRIHDNGPISAFGDQFTSDGLSLFVTAVVFASLALVATVLPGWCLRAGVAGPEVYVLLLLSASGAVVMAGADDLIVLFLGLETMSIALYVMAALDRRRLRSLEAGIKYFVLGAFASAFFLYGIALVYGAAGTTGLAGISAYFRDTLVLQDGLLLIGVALLLVGLGFKVAAAPFHAWVPDVYQGAPAPVTAFMASAVKAAGFAALLRVLAALEVRAPDWRPAVFALACATLVVGAVLAAVQSDVKRLLAYSSVAHAGFILVGVQTASPDGTAAVLFYLGAYSVIAVGSFTVLGALPGAQDDRVGFEVLAGLGARRPALAAAFTALLLAQAGVPFTSGFVAKLSVVSAAAEARSYWLAVVAMVSAVIAAFAYLRVVVAMYFTEPPSASESAAAGRLRAGPAAVIALAVLVTVAVGLFPDLLDSAARDAAARLTSARLIG